MRRAVVGLLCVLALGWTGAFGALCAPRAVAQPAPALRAPARGAGRAEARATGSSEPPERVAGAGGRRGGPFLEDARASPRRVAPCANSAAIEASSAPHIDGRARLLAPDGMPEQRAGSARADPTASSVGADTLTEGAAHEAAPSPARGGLERPDRRVAGPVGYGPGRGLSLRSEDGAFGLVTRGRLQIRHTAEREPGAGWDQEVIARRARVVFGGNLFGPYARFKLELGLSPRDRSAGAASDRGGPERTPLLDGYLELRPLRDLNFRLGQYKVPFSRQRVVSSADLQMVDRSIVNAGFNLDRDVGFDLRSSDLFGLEMLRYHVGVYLGQGRDAVGVEDLGLMYLARLEVLPLGPFEDYREADFARSRTARVSVGVAGAFIDRAPGTGGILGRRPADGGTTNTQHLTADFVFMYAGLSFTSELMLRTGQRNPGDAVDDAGVAIPVEPAHEGWGVMAQAGYLLPDLPLEIAARFGATRPLGQASPMPGRNELGIVLSYYVAGHLFKVQLDAFQLWGDAFGAGTTRLRLQLQASL